METSQLKELQVFAAQLRMDILEMLEHRGYGHLGGSLSIVELMSVLYGKQLRVDPKNPKMEDRDMVRDLPGTVRWQRRAFSTRNG